MSYLTALILYLWALTGAITPEDATDPRCTGDDLRTCLQEAYVGHGSAKGDDRRRSASGTDISNGF